MSPATVHERLKAVRERQDIVLPRPPNFRETLVRRNGTEVPLLLRPYQIQMVVHLMAMRRFVVGDDCGLGKCVTGDTLILTDQGLLPISSLSPDSHKEPGMFYDPPFPVRVWTGDKWASVRRFYFDGTRHTRKITTRSGFVVEGSEKHPLLTRTGHGEGFVRTPNIQIGDHLCVCREEAMWPEQEPLVPGSPRAFASHVKSYDVPSTLTPELSRLLGYFVAEGHSPDRYTFVITQHDAEAHADIRSLLKSLFGWEGNESNQQRDISVSVTSVVIRDFLERCGVGFAKSSGKVIPPIVLRGTKASAREFLRGLFEGDGHALPGSGVEYTTASEQMSREIQTLLLRFGIVGVRSSKVVRGTTYWRIKIFGDDARRFYWEIAFVTSRKNRSLEALLSKRSNPNRDVVPHVSGLVSDLYFEIKDRASAVGNNDTRKGSGIKRFGNGFGVGLREVIRGVRDLTYSKLGHLLEVARLLDLSSSTSYQALNVIMNRQFFYDPVVSIEVGFKEVMDIEVDDPQHCFVGNGFINHNTIESIAGLCQLWKRDPDMKVIVLTKKSSVPQWESEFGKFTDGVTVCMAVGTPKKRQKAQEAWEQATGPTVLIQGYTSACNDLGRIQHWEGYTLILDEVTVVKTPTTRVHKVCRHLSAQAERCWGLTATLIKNNLMEGYGIYRVVVPDLFQMSRNAFMNNYCITRMQRVANGRQVPQIVGYRQSDIAKFRDQIDLYYLGRPKHAVAKDLPVLTTKTVRVGMTKFQHSKYQEALAGLLELGDGDERETTQLTALIYCQEIVNHPALIEYPDYASEKLDALVDMVTEGGDFYDEKIIVFTRFKEMVNHAIPVLESKGVKCVRVTGSENEYQRKAAMDAFQDPDDPTRVIWITMAGGDAINLQTAKALVFYDSPWSAGDYLQCLDQHTEILTPDGFRGRGAIAQDDLVGAFDPNTEEIIWTPARSVVDRPLASDEEMFAVSSPHMDVRVTGGHRMLFKRPTRKGGRKGWPVPWRVETAEEMSEEASEYRVPAAGVQKSNGVELSDPELRFLGWFLSDGCLNQANQQVVISQANHQPQIVDLRRCLSDCGFDWSEYPRIPKGFPNGKPQTVFSVPKGGEGGTRARNGWGPLQPFLDKDLSPRLEAVSSAQLAVLLEALHLGDGAKQRGQSWTRRSYHIGTANLTFAERLQSLCVRRGFRCNLAQTRAAFWTLHIKPTPFWSLNGNEKLNRPRMQKAHSKPGEPVWCVETDLGTIITRRNGKVAIVGNCIGRMIRIGSEHDTCYAIHLVCRDTIDERVMQVIRKKMGLIEQVLGERVKGKREADVVYEAGSEVKDLFDAMVADARTHT